MGPFGTGIELTPGRGRAGRACAAFVFDGMLPPGATLTRASAAMVTGADGLLASVPANAARFDRDPATGAVLGLLIEPAATNPVAGSAALNGGGWSGYRASVAADVAVAPDGTASADRIGENSKTGPQVCAQALSLAAGPAALSAYLKAAERGHAVLALNPGGTGGNYAFARFDLVAGTVVTSGAQASTLVAAGIAPAGGGWWRAWIKAVLSAADPYVYLGPDDGAGGAPGAFGIPDRAGIAGAGVLAWGVQVETGGPTSPIATDGGAASRAADMLTLDWARLGVGDGAATIRYGFDDGSHQDVATTIAGGLATVPATLNRRRLRRAETL